VHENDQYLAISIAILKWEEHYFFFLQSEKVIEVSSKETGLAGDTDLEHDFWINRLTL
jgi:hypothetical protein